MNRKPSASTFPRLKASRAVRDDIREAWREARDESWRAYRAWCSASMAARRTAYAVYVAAADRETAAETAFLNALRAA
jgi:hypothetical protein